jgi:hypothetical protein
MVEVEETGDPRGRWSMMKKGSVERRTGTTFHSREQFFILARHLLLFTLSDRTVGNPLRIILSVPSLFSISFYIMGYGGRKIRAVM